LALCHYQWDSESLFILTVWRMLYMMYKYKFQYSENVIEETFGMNWDQTHLNKNTRNRRSGSTGRNNNDREQSRELHLVLSFLSFDLPERTCICVGGVRA